MAEREVRFRIQQQGVRGWRAYPLDDHDRHEAKGSAASGEEQR